MYIYIYANMPAIIYDHNRLTADLIPEMETSWSIIRHWLHWILVQSVMNISVVPVFKIHVIYSPRFIRFASLAVVQNTEE